MYHEFPNQNIPEEKKDNLKWHKKHAYAFFGYSNTVLYNNRLKEIEELTYAILAEPSKSEADRIKATLTQQYGSDFQVQYQVYPLIEQKIEEVIGHYRLRPLKSKTSVINRTAISSKLQEITDRVSEAIQRELNTSLSEEAGVELGSDNPDIEVPDLEKVDDFIENYRTESEKIGELVLDYILNAKGEKEAIYNALAFYLGFGDVAFFIEEKDGNPSLYIPHPSEYYSDLVPTSDIQSDAEIVALDQWYSQNEILNKFDLTKKEKEQLDEIFKGNESQFTVDGDLSFNSDTFIRNIGGLRKCRVVTLYWKSRRKLEYSEYENKRTKQKEAKRIPDTIKEKDKRRVIEKDELSVFDVENIRHITMIGHDLALSWGTLKDQLTSVGDPRKRFNPFVRLVSDNTLRTGKVRSLAKKLKFLQDLASEVLWEMRFNIRQMDGNVLVYDTSMFPKELFGELGKSNRAENALNKVMRLLKKDRVMFINSKDKRSNHYASSVNVSQKGRTQDLMNMFALIESIADKISGIPSRQENQVYQKATVAELQAQNTTARLEEYFGPFEAALEKALNYLVSKGQQIYKANDILSYIGGDKTQKFILINESFSNDDLGIKFVNNRKDYESKMIIDQTASRMMSSTDNFDVMIGMLDVLDSENYEEAKQILTKYKDKLEEDRAAANQAQQEQANAQLQAEQAKEDRLYQDKQLDRESKERIEKWKLEGKANADNLKEQNANIRKAAEIEAQANQQTKNSQE